MYPILILRAEFVCLILLLFLLSVSKAYKLGKDRKTFMRLILFALMHVVFDIITVVTVNNMGVYPGWFNDICHFIFYLSAICYSKEIMQYCFDICYPDISEKASKIAWVVPIVYLAALPFLGISYDEYKGTNSSAGTAAIIGYSIALIYFAFGIVIVLKNRRRINKSVRGLLLPMMLTLIVVEVVQAIYKPLLFTGCAITIVTVGFFFSMENPVFVLEMKLLTDALTGMRSRHSYDQDVQKIEEEYAHGKSNRYIFAFCDINLLRDVNNRYGHAEGDNYILLVATALSLSLSSAKDIYRIGGDEFLVLYDGIDEKTVKKELESVNQYIMSHNQNVEYTPSIAYGYAVSGGDFSTIAEVIRAADQAMYKNKNAMHVQLYPHSDSISKFDIL